MAHSVKLTWLPPTTGDAPASYDIKRAPAASGPFTSIGTSTVPTFTDTNVVAGETWFYEAFSVNSAGESTPSNEVTAVIPTTFPGPPTGLVAEVA